MVLVLAMRGRAAGFRCPARIKALKAEAVREVTSIVVAGLVVIVMVEKGVTVLAL